MYVSLPIILTLGLLFSSIFPAWRLPQPLKIETIELRAGHGFGSNDEDQPSGSQLTYLLPSLGIPLTREIGNSRIHGRILWNPEIELGMFSQPNVRPLFGVQPLQFRFQFSDLGKWTPYFMGGFGGIYTRFNKQETGSDYNFSLVSGAGTGYRLTQNTFWLLEYRHHHISNGGTNPNNSGIDSHVVLTGFSFVR